MNNTFAAQAAGAATGSSSGSGNQTLNDAFDYALKEAQQTLTITTKKGADLYALKQRPQ
ncbi:hypothetical protein [Zhengella mangrovi]|uniref:hypothetical protein n=1 Tax=Zhengella mangrovi TaxID=1982044 RepID=UPI0013FD63D6|nr:hypothetical protein [Zhengella mangrovi]